MGYCNTQVLSLPPHNNQGFQNVLSQAFLHVVKALNVPTQPAWIIFYNALIKHNNK